MIEFTPEAASRFQKVIHENPEVSVFRVYVQGAGCAGFQYGFEFTNPENDDLVFESNGGKIVVDPLSYQYLMGSKVDYKKELMGEYFTLDNPTATTTCGCGKSFGV